MSKPRVRIAVVVVALLASVFRLGSPSVAAAAGGDLYAAGTGYCVSTYVGHAAISGFGEPVDINADSGDLDRKVFAPGDGAVTNKTTSGSLAGGFGNWIVWASADGSERLQVAHLASVVKTGPVQAGDLIAYAGNTGLSTPGTAGDKSAHLHVSRSVKGSPAKVVLSGRTLEPGTTTNCTSGPHHYVSIGPVDDLVGWTTKRLTTDHLYGILTLDVDAGGHWHAIAVRSDGRGGSLSYFRETGSEQRFGPSAYYARPSMALDADGKVHVAYERSSNVDFNDDRYDVAIYYSTNKSGSWVTTRISTTTSDLAFSPSLALDPTGKVHIAYSSHEESTQGVRYATDRTGTWTTSLVSSAYAWDGPSIAVDGLGKVHIAVANYPSGIYYLTNTSGSWVTSRRTTRAGDGDPSIAVDVDRKIHIAFSNWDATAGGVYYLTNRSGSWTTSRRTTSTSDHYATIDVDTAGKAHIAFSRDGLGVRYTSNKTGSWVTKDPFNAVGAFSSYPAPAAIALSPSGIPTIATAQPGFGVAWSTYLGSSNWLGPNLEQIDIDFQSPRVTSDSAGKLHLAAFRQGAAGGMYYATNRTGSWVWTRLTNDGGAYVPADIAVDAVGHAHIVYQVANLSDEAVVTPAIYATNVTGSWAFMDIGPATHDEVAVDAFGVVHIVQAYWPTEESTQTIWYWKSVGGWTQLSSSGYRPSIAVDAAGKTHVVYEAEWPNVGLRYVTNKSGSWTTTPITSSDDSFPTVVVDGAGKVVVAFTRDAELRLTTNRSGTWVGPKVVAGYFGPPELVVDAANKLHVVATQYESSSVVYLTNESGDWLMTSLGSSTGTPTLTVDPVGGIHIVYDRWALGAGGLMYTHD